MRLARTTIAAGARHAARRLGASMALGAAQFLGPRGRGRGAWLARAACRTAALAPLARRLAASPTPAHRELAELLAAALADGDDATALALAATAVRGPDLRAEKILSHRYRFIWICIPKAASRTLIATLLAADSTARLIRHRTLEQVLARHPEARAYFRFAFLRHPAERIRSFYADKHTLARRDANARRWFIAPYHGLSLGMSFAELCRWLATPCGADAFADRHWLSQPRLIAGADGRLPDFLGRCERLEEDWRAVADRLGLPPARLRRLNATDPRLRGQAIIDTASAALLRHRYAEDFALGGYGDTP